MMDDAVQDVLDELSDDDLAVLDVVASGGSAERTELGEEEP